MWVIFAEYVRYRANECAMRAVRVYPLSTTPETTRTDADVWANPVFVGGEKKRTAGCQNVLGPSSNANRKNAFI